MNDTTYVCAQSLMIFLLAEENMLFAILIILVIQMVFRTNKYYGVYDMVWYMQLYVTYQNIWFKWIFEL